MQVLYVVASDCSTGLVARGDEAKVAARTSSDENLPGDARTAIAMIGGFDG